MSYIDVLNDAANRADAASTKAEGASKLLEDIANGPEGSYVTTINGQVPTAATVIDDLTTQITSGVLAPISEEVTLTAGQTQVTFTGLDTSGLAVYINEGSGAYRYFNFTVEGSNSIVLGDSFGSGTILWGVAQEIGGDVQTAVDQTQANAQLAEDWAILTGQTVDGTEYSAKHYSEESAASASAAATSESNAADSAASALTSEQNAANTLDEFDDRYLGSKSTEPTTDNDGDELVEGAVYWDSNEKNLKYWNGTSWQTWTDATQISNDDSGQSMSAPTVQDAIDTLDSTTVALDVTDKNIVKLNRSLQRSGDIGQTLHADFAYGAYGIGDHMSGGVDAALSGEELFTVERATPKRVFGPNGKLREVPPNTIARQWNPATGEPEGVLIEESRTNLLTYSEDFTKGGWNTQDLTVSSDVSEAPDGSATAGKLTEGTGTSVKFTRQSVGTLADNFVATFSLFIRASELTQVRVAIREKSGDYRGANFDLVTGETIGADSGLRSCGIKRVSNGWFRVSVTHDIGADSNNTATMGLVYLLKDGSTVYTGDGTSGLYIWGAQLEQVGS